MDTKGVIVVFNMFVRHALSPVSSECWVREYFCHYIRKLVVRVDVREVHNIFSTPISDDMVSNIDVFGAFCDHKVRRHAYRCLIVLVENNWFLEFHVQFLETRSQPDKRITRSSYLPVFDNS